MVKDDGRSEKLLRKGKGVFQWIPVSSHHDPIQPSFYAKLTYNPVKNRKLGLSAVYCGLASWVRNITVPIFRWYESRAVIRIVEALNEHRLVDVGIERTDIPTFVAKGQKMDKALQ